MTNKLRPAIEPMRKRRDNVLWPNKHYDRLGRYRKREVQLPFWPCVALLVGAWVVARVVL